MDKKVKKKRARTTQARGRRRREKLVRAAKSLLDQQSLETISLADVAEAANIPIGSIYHFFPSINALFEVVTQQFFEELDTVFRENDYQINDGDNWQTIIDQAVDRVTHFYNVNPGYQQLILGGKAPPEIKVVDRENDLLVGQLLIDVIKRHFMLPEFPRAAKVFFNSTQLADSFLSLSVIREQRITDEARAECKRAVRAYLRTYLPDELPLRQDPDDSPLETTAG